MCELRFKHSRISLGLGFALVSLLLALGLQGQVSSPGESSSIIQKNVDEVSLDLIVHNKKNKEVLDLTPEDIKVTDNGVPEQITSLHLLAGQAGVPDRPITLLFDHLDPAAAANARSIAEKIVKMTPAHGFQFSVMEANQRLGVVQPFTSDTQVIKAAIGAATVESATQRNQAVATAENELKQSLQTGTEVSADRVSTREQKMQQVMLGSLEEYREIAQSQSCNPALCGLLAMVRIQAQLRGRKVIIYFAQGMQADSNISDALKSIIAAADRAEVTIFAINTSGIDPREFAKLTQTIAIGNAMAYNRMNPAPTAATTPAGLVSQPVQAAWIAKAVNDQLDRFEADGMEGYKDPLNALAVGTGGTYVAAGGTFRKPMKQMIADLSSYYELSYVPHLQEYDGKFHTVAIEALRKGIKVRSGPGYFALPPNETSGTWAFEIPLLKALSAPELPSDLHLQERVLQMGPLGDGATKALVVAVPLSEADTRADANTNLLSWHISMVAQIKNKAGTVVEHYSEDIPGRVALGTQATKPLEVSMQRHFMLPPGTYTVEAAAMDRLSGKVGAIRQTVEILAEPAGPFLSDITRVRQLEPSSGRTDPFDPFRYRENTVVPSLTADVPIGAKDVSLFFLVHSDPTISRPATLEMQVLRNGELLAETPLQLPAGSDGSTIPYLASMNTSALPAGSYQVIENLTQGERVLERTTEFVIRGVDSSSKIASLNPQPTGQHEWQEPLASSNAATSQVGAKERPPLQISPLPEGSALRPSPGDLDEMIAGSRERALSYSAKLPNFVCVEITDRSVDPSGKGQWRHRDSYAELLRFRDHHETRTTLEVNGHPSAIKRTDMDGPLSVGEFGDMLSSVFQPASKADFQWKGSGRLANGIVQIFEYRVNRQNASMALSDSKNRIYAGFHGLIYVDSSTFGVRRITMEADDLPKNFSIHAASLTIDYDYVAIGTHDYLMPVRGEIRLQRGRRQADLNQIVFQDYKRYGAQIKISAAP